MIPTWGVSGIPSWVLPGVNTAGADLYFANGLYYAGTPTSVGSVISTSRASSGYAQTVAGALLSFSSNVPRITDQGLLVEEARTNKTTNFNANPTDLTNITKTGDAAATLAVVDDTAALLAGGLQNICTSGKVYKLDNTAGTGDAFALPAGTQGNTNPHSYSIYARGPQSAWRFGNSSSVPNRSDLTAAYARAKLENVSTTAANTLTVGARAGGIVFFILNQLEEGAFTTSPIVVAGSSTTRAADVLSLLGSAAIAALSAKSLYGQTNGGEGITTSARIADFNGTQLVAFNSTSVVRASNGTNSADATLGSGSYSTRVKSAAGFDATSITALANNGTQATSANAWGTPSGTVYIGNRSAGDRALNGYLERIAFGPNKGMFDGLTA